LLLGALCLLVGTLVVALSLRPRPVTLMKHVMPSEAPAAVPHANSRVHVFYYNWWGTPEHDGAWFHWDHEVLDDVKPRRRHDPAQGRIGSTHWPQLGPYSSADPAVVARHCRQLREAGAGVLVVAWYSRDRADQKADLFAGFQDRSIPLIAAEAAKVGLRVAFHSEPYPGRSAASVAADAAYICREYGALPGVYRHDGPRGALPML
jgi:glycoprotein endo-alpha-1,2-mannosidase